MATPSGQGWFPQGTKAWWVKGWGVLPRREVLASPPGLVPPHCHLARPLDAELLRQDAQGHGGTPPPRRGWSLLCTQAEETSLEALHSFFLGLGVAAGSLANGWLLGPTHGELRKKTKPPSLGVEVSGAEVGSLQSL